MTAVVLHLSDIHIRGAKDPILLRAKNIAACVYAYLPEATHVFIVISGDVAYEGIADQYKLAEAFFQQIGAEIRREKKIPVHFIVCPGNHDCDFTQDTQIRQFALEALARKGTDTIDESVIKACCVVQQPYFKFAASLNDEYSSTEGDQLWRTLRYDVKGKEVVFDCINIAWTSKVHEEPGGLAFPYQRYIRDDASKPELRVAVMHHPFHWLSQTVYQGFRKALRTAEHLVITGHEHIGNFGENVDTESGLSTYVEGCVLQGEKDLADSGFNVLVLDLDKGMYRAIRYDWHGSLYEVNEEGSWDDYRSIPVKARNPFDLEARFRELLADPGASFKRLTGQEITLGDIFVFPDLMAAGESQEEKQVSSSQILADPERIRGGVIIEGEDRAGATSLLYQLYERYYEQGFVPVLLQGANIRGATVKDVEAAVEQAVAEQYGKQAIERFRQLDKEKRILLVDDFSECRLAAAAHRARVLELIAARFDRFIFIVGELFNIQEVVAQAPDAVRRALQHFNLMLFGYALRAKLARRWFQLTARDGSLDESQVAVRCDQAEKLMDAAMVRNIVPSVPIYLLTLLQSVDAGLSGQFQDSGLGAYYTFLIDENLRAGGIQPAKWDEVIEYSADLAWFFHSKQSRELAKESLREFNERFSRERHTVEFAKRLEDLVVARVLAVSDDHYRFRYHYTYYLLKGRYITRNLADSEMTAYVERCCRHLYVRENANTILFMAHHQAGQPFVMDKILQSLDNLFPDKEYIRFCGDTQKIDALVRDLPRLEYSGGDPDGHREKANKFRDKKALPDGLAEAEETGPALSLIATIVMVFKTVEILGQLLQNQFAALGRDRRMDVLEKLFQGPLKALTGYFDFLSQNPETLMAEIDAALRDKGKIKDAQQRQRMVRQIVAVIVQITTLGFVHKAASSVSAESLIEDVTAVAKKNKSIAFRLIDLATKLDTLRKLPKQEIEQLASATDGDLLANRTFQLLILRHLYMFRTSEMDKQWLASKKVVAIRTQKAIDVKTAKTKRLK